MTDNHDPVSSQLSDSKNLFHNDWFSDNLNSCIRKRENGIITILDSEEYAKLHRYASNYYDICISQFPQEIQSHGRDENTWICRQYQM